MVFSAPLKIPTATEAPILRQQAETLRQQMASNSWFDSAANRRVLSNLDARLSAYDAGLGQTHSSVRVGDSDAGPILVGATVRSAPPLPHPDASNLALGPNLGGSDAVSFPGESAALPGGTGSGSSNAGGLLLLGVVGVLVFVALRRK